MPTTLHVLSSVHIYDEYNNYENYEAPLYLDDPLTADVEEAADAIEEARAANGDGEKVSYGGMMTGDTVEQFVNSYIESATIIDTKTKAEQKITNKAQLCEIMTSVQSICYGRVSMFSVPDYDYYVLIDLKNGARSYDLFLTYFIDGKAPEFVK